MTEILPCPFCGAPAATSIANVPGRVACWSSKCMVVGPIGGAVEDAIAAWNAAPRAPGLDSDARLRELTKGQGNRLLSTRERMLWDATLVLAGSARAAMCAVDRGTVRLAESLLAAFDAATSKPLLALRDAGTDLFRLAEDVLEDLDTPTTPERRNALIIELRAAIKRVRMEGI